MNEIKNEENIIIDFRRIFIAMPSKIIAENRYLIYNNYHISEKENYHIDSLSSKRND